MSKKAQLIEDMVNKGVEVKASTPMGISIDKKYDEILEIISDLILHVRTSVTRRTTSREDVQNLKDCMSMLNDLKKRESEILEDLTEEELLELLYKKKNYGNIGSSGS